MKKVMTLLLAGACAFGGYATNEVAATSAAKPKSLKVLMIGNSFSLQMLSSMPPVAKDLGLELDIGSLYIGGCTLDRHWKNVCAPESRPYSVGRVTNGKGRGGSKGNIPDLLKAEKWDVVTIQQGSHASWRPESYHPYGDNLVKTIRELAPQAKIVVHETWSYTPFDNRLAGWKIDQNEMYEKLHAAYADFARAYGFEVIPTGTAVQEWRKRLPVKYVLTKGEQSLGGDCCGSAVPAKDEKTGNWWMKGDKFHMNGKGNHLQALVWTAKLFGADVTKCTYHPKCVSEEQAVLMRKIAMDVVK